jgi:serine/threonine-protein kinase
MTKRRLEGYQIVAELGRGGMSTVHKAVQVSLERAVAIKEIHPNFSNSPELIARFEREAHAIAQLSHPCIVQIHDYIHDGDAHFMVMEFIEGVDLKGILERRDCLNPEETLALAVRVSAALAYAHAVGIIHRDIKPSNILLTREGQVKVVDFGIARMEEGEELTRTGAFVGTPAYMSPEQILGERLDGRSDVFSLGVVLYEALAGEKPFSDDSQRSVQARILKSAPPRLRRRAPGVSRQLERLVMRCLEKQRDRRFSSMSELNLAVRAALPKGERQRPRALAALAARLQEAPAQGKGKSRAGSVATATTAAVAGIPFRRRLGFAASLALTVGVGTLIWQASQRPAPPASVTASSGAPAGAGVRPGRRPEAAPELPARAPAEPAPQNAPPISGEPGSRSAAASEDPAEPQVPAGAPPGLLKLVVEPWAEVRVDGRLYDTTPFESPIPLSPGEHTIELVHETLPSRRLTVLVRPGETKRIHVDLRR